MYPFSHPAVIRLVSSALEEDTGRGDATTFATVLSGQKVNGCIRAKSEMVIAGLPLVDMFLSETGERQTVRLLKEDGDIAAASSMLLTFNGSASGLLTAERALLNILQHLCGVATLTRRYVELVEGTECTIVDTRKTLPGLRILDKYAVTQGGGRNHRFGLDDGILIKDNHIAVCGGVKEAVGRARGKASNWLKIEVECRTLPEVREALDAGTDIILLDNMGIAETRQAVKIIDGHVLVEASGNMSLERVREIAEAGVDLISVGALTHSAPAADLSMEMIPAVTSS